MTSHYRFLPASHHSWTACSLSPGTGTTSRSPRTKRLALRSSSRYTARKDTTKHQPPSTAPTAPSNQDHQSSPSPSTTKAPHISMTPTHEQQTRDSYSPILLKPTKDPPPAMTSPSTGQPPYEAQEHGGQETPTTPSHAATLQIRPPATPGQAQAKRIPHNSTHPPHQPPTEATP